jgi:hypothetical protein
MTTVKCQSKNPASCRVHGWIKAPLTSEEARDRMNEFRARLQTVSGSTAFAAVIRDFDNAHIDFIGTPEGEREHLQRIEMLKEGGWSTIADEELLNKAKIRRAIKEAEFKSAVFQDKALNLNVEDVKKLFKGTDFAVRPMSTLNPSGAYELNSKDGKAGWLAAFPTEQPFRKYDIHADILQNGAVHPLDFNTKEGRLEASAKALGDFRVDLAKRAANKKYNKPAIAKITAEAKSYGLRLKKNPDPRWSNEILLSRKDGSVLASLTVKEDGSFNSGKVPLDPQRGTVNTINDPTQFRTWLDNYRGNDASIWKLPEWAS